jgi:DnaD/phage-associated family protein
MDSAEVVAWYFFNTPRSRKVVTELQGGEIIPVRLLTNEVPEEGYLEQDSHSDTSAPVNEYAASREYNAAATETGRNLPARHVQVQVERPNIFVLYEQNIGLLSPLIAEELRDAADQYPAEWIEAAFREAVLQNKRRWNYIRAILKRWETEGRQAWNA